MRDLQSHKTKQLVHYFSVNIKIRQKCNLSEPIFCGNLVYNIKSIVEKPLFSDQFKKITKRYKKSRI